MSVFNTRSSVVPQGGYGGKYESPWGKGDTKIPSWDTGKSKDIDWNQGFGVDTTGLYERTFGQLMDKAKNTDKYRREMQGKSTTSKESAAADSTKSAIGSGIQGGSSSVLDNLGVVTPSQHAPVVIPGTPGKRGFASQIAGIAAPVVGLMGGPTAPFIAAGLGGLSQTDW